MLAMQYQNFPHTTGGTLQSGCFSAPHPSMLQESMFSSRLDESPGLLPEHAGGRCSRGSRLVICGRLSDSTPAPKDAFFCLKKFTFCPQKFFYPRFLNEDGRIRKIRLSKLHY